MTEVAITELEKIDADRIDGVGMPANGIPILLLKQVAAPAAAPDAGEAGKPAEFDREAAKSLVRGIIAKAVGPGGQVDESPDIQAGTEVLAQIFDLIISEAQEGKAGNVGEICDIFELCCAAEKIWCWRTGEEAVSAGSVMPATALVQSAAAKADLSARELNDLPDSAFAYIEPGGSKDSEGKTTPRSKRHFAIHDKAHADNAAARIAQGAKFGEQALPKVKAAQEKFGEKPAVSKGEGEIAEDGATVDTVSKEIAGQVAKLGEDVAGLTKALAASEERSKSLEAELAKVKAAPVPGGPMMTPVGQRKAADDGEDHAVKALQYDWWAERLSDPSSAEEYRKLAARERAKITTE